MVDILSFLYYLVYMMDNSYNQGERRRGPRRHQDEVPGEACLDVRRRLLPRHEQAPGDAICLY